MFLVNSVQSVQQRASQLRVVHWPWLPPYPSPDAVQVFITSSCPLLFFFFFFATAHRIFPDEGIKPVSPEVEAEVLTTGLPGKSVLPLLLWAESLPTIGMLQPNCQYLQKTLFEDMVFKEVIKLK